MPRTRPYKVTGVSPTASAVRGGLPAARAGWREDVAGPRFGARLIGTLLVTLVLSGAAAVLLEVAVLENSLVDDAQRLHADDARMIERIVSERSPEAPTMESATEIVRVFASRAETEYVVLIDSTRRVVASSERAKIGSLYAGSDVTAALLGGSRAGLRGEGRREHLALFTRIVLEGRPFVLHTEREARVIARARATARHQAVISALISLALAIPSFYLFGGRRLARVHRAAVTRSRQDGLTGLRNHATFDADLRRAVDAARRGASVALAVMDLDRFKTANDQFGHRHGDAILAAVADELTRLRAGERAYRIGGDEFGVLLTGHEVSRVQSTLEGLRHRIESRVGEVTASVGFTMYDESDTEHTLWERADQAMYAAKAAGGNRVRAADAPGTNAEEAA